MTIFARAWWPALLGLAAIGAGTAHANAYRERGRVVAIAGSALTVTPPRDWNRLDMKRGKFAETWTLDGEQLNDVTFYHGVTPGAPLLRERDRRRQPLPRFTAATLLVEVPELLEATYRASKGIGSFTLTASRPQQFLGRTGIGFTYDFVDQDSLPRKGEGRAVLIGGKLYMATFDAPRLHYFDRALPEFRALADTARLTP